MILTCPECGTSYVVKDGAIPPGGRKVRCASCKHSWHQPGDEAAGAAAASEIEEQAALAEVSVASSPAPDLPPPEIWPAAPEREPPAEEAPAVADQASPPAAGEIEGPDERQWRPVDTGSAWDQPAAAADDPVEFDGMFDPGLEEEQPRRRWPWVLVALLVVGAIAAALWFLAPDSVRQRLGLMHSGATPLMVMNDQKDIQRLESGTSLATVSGRVINPTDEAQSVPPIRVELLDASKSKVVYSWTIAPPVAVIAGNQSMPFHSAEMGVPDNGRFIRFRLGA